MQCQVRVFITEDKKQELNKLKHNSKGGVPFDTGWYVCENEAQGIARCHDVCNTHFKQFRADNYNRGEDDPEIEDNFDLIKVPSTDKKSFYKQLVKEVTISQETTNEE